MKNPINPSHYSIPNLEGFELIDFIEHLPFVRGNAIKYIFRAGRKDAEREIEDLKKAEWLIRREIQKLSDKEGIK